MSDSISVCYFGAYRSNYPRNLAIRRAMSLAGMSVAECRVPPQWPTWRRWPSLVTQFVRQPSARAAPVIIVAEFCHSIVPLAWTLSRLTKAALVFDPGISFYDEMIICQRLAPQDSLRARYLEVLDTCAFTLPDVVMWFTPVDAEYFGKIYRIPPHRTGWLPPGVDEDLFAYTPPFGSESPFVIHWDGSFIPSHGVEVILEAARQLRDEREIRFELVGDGPMADAMKARAKSMQLANVFFLGRVPADELVASVRRAHICLGAFRADDKQRRTLYTKELQAMMVGRAVVTADGEAKRRLFVAGEDLFLIPPDSPADLAEAIRALRSDNSKRRMLGERGHAAVKALCTSTAIQDRLVDILRQAVVNRRRGVVGQEPSPPL